MKSKRVILAIVFFSLVVVKGFSQGMPVFDMSNFMQAVLTVKSTYDSYRAQIEQLKYQFEAAKAQAQAIQNADIDSFRDAVEFADQNLTYLRQTEAAFKRMGIRVNGRVYALDELYAVPDAMINEAFGQEFSDAQKAQIWAQYGLKPANYFYQQKLRESASETFGRATAFALMDEEGEYTEQLAQSVGDLAEKAQGQDSAHAVGQLQAQQNAAMSAQLASMQVTMQEMLKVAAVQGQMLLEATSNGYVVPEFPEQPLDPDNAISSIMLADIVD